MGTSDIKEQIKEYCIKDVDGYYKYSPRDISGMLDEDSIRLIWDVLRELNMSWEAEVYAALAGGEDL